MRSGKMDTISYCGMFVLSVFLLFDFSNCQQQQQEQQQNPGQLFQKYHETVQSVKSQDQRVKNIYIEIQETNSFAENLMEELKEQQQIFIQVTKNFENIVWLEPTQKSAEDILNIRANFIESSKKVQEASKNYSQITQELYEQQKDFDQQLQILQNLEKNVTDIYQDLYAITKLVIPSDYDTLEYINPIEISENEFGELLDTGVVKNVVLNIESKEQFNDFYINKTSTIIQRLQVTHAWKNTLSYLRLIFSDKNQKLIIKDAEFSGVGLLIFGIKGGNNEISIENFSSQNSPGSGLVIEYCDNCKIENILVKNTKLQGIYFTKVNNCTVDNATVLGAGGHGIYLDDYKVIIKNSFIQNSRDFGIRVGFGQVTGQNVTFSGNAKGHQIGNYITQ